MSTELKTLNGYGFDATKLGGLDAQYYAQGRAAYNLLHNSDFRAGWRIAQAGMNGIHGSVKYACDRWISWDADAIFTDEYIKPMSPLDQRLNPAIIEMNATYTVAVCLSDGTVRVDSGTFANGFGSYGLGIYCPPATTQPFVRLASEGDRFRWADLYLGAYTADNLPEHQPKGYAAELAECQRYYREVYRVFGKDVGNIMREAIILNPPMRIPPTSTVKSLWKGNDGTSVTVNSTANDNADVTYTGWGNATIAFSADL